MSHTVQCAPLGLSVAIYAHIMGVKQLNALRVQKVAEVCKSARCHTVRCGGTWGEMQMENSS